MASATIPVDLFNPGQVFACLGIAEATSVLTGSAFAGFAEDQGRVSFHVEGAGETSPIARVLDFLAQAEVCSLAPSESELSTEKWGVPTRVSPARADFPTGPPSSPAALPAVLRVGSEELVLDHWGDTTQRDNVKFWAGSAGYPGVGLLRDALDLARPHLATAHGNPFAVHAPQSSSFRFDWRRDYVPLGIGFSLNNHGKMTPRGYPLVEILAALGMSHARPERPERSNKLVYRYGIPLEPNLPLPLLRVALGGDALPFPSRTFRMTLEWPGQEGQARCITDVVEENRP